MSEAHGLSPSESPFFLVGAVRSGTTLLRLLLGHHSEICRCEEMEFVTTPYAEHGGFPPRDEYRRYLELDRGFRMSGYTADGSQDFPELARDFLRQRQAADGKRLVGATVHNHFDLLPRLWPEARYVFLTRDPRDVARSCVQMGWVGTAWGGARFWLDAQEQWRKLCLQVPAEQRHEVRFEDLIERSTAVLAGICEFLGTRYDPAMLEIERDTTYRRPNPAESRSWRDSARVRDVRLVEARIGAEALEAAGYQHSGYPALRRHLVERARIALEDAVVRIRFRGRRYGWPLWLAGVLSRRLPWRAARERTRLRMDEIDNQHLK